MHLNVVPRLSVALTLGLAAVVLTVAAAIGQEASPGVSIAPARLSPLPAGSPSPAPSPSTFHPEGDWKVRAFDAWAEGLKRPRAADVSVDLLAEDRLEGESGCGAYFGAYQVQGQSIIVDVVAKGTGECGPRISDEAADFIHALEASTAWQATDDGLELIDADGVVRVDMTPETEGGIEGQWQVTAYARPNGKLQAAPEDGSMALHLAPEGVLLGSTGCRILEGEYRGDREQVLIVPTDITGLPCEGPSRKAEKRLLAALELVVLWRRDGDELSLTDAYGSPLLELRPAMAVAATPEPSADPST